MGTSSLIVGAAGLILIAILVLVVADAVLSKRADAADASVTAPELAGPSVHPARPIKPIKPVKPMCSMRPEDWMY